MPPTQPVAAIARWRLLLPLFTVVAIDAAGAGILLPLLPLYARNFGASPIVIGLLLASFSLSQFCPRPCSASLPTGWAASGSWWPARLEHV
jgi:hypothetical protein